MGFTPVRDNVRTTMRYNSLLYTTKYRCVGYLHNNSNTVRTETIIKSMPEP